MREGVSTSPRSSRRPAETGLVAVLVLVVAAAAFGTIGARSGPASDVGEPTGVAATTSFVDAPETAATPASRFVTASTSSAPDVWEEVTVVAADRPDPAARTIEIDTTAIRQTWDGVGAALTDSSAALLATSPDAITRLFADPVDGGAGLDLVRLPLSSTDFSVRDWTWVGTDDGIVVPPPEAAAALDVLDAIEAVRPDLGVVGAAWTSPATFRTQPDRRGGFLRDDSVEAYADFLIEQVDALVAAGVDLRAMSLGNEPGHVGDYPTLGMTDEQMLALARRVAPSLDAADVDLLALDHNWSDAERAARLVERGPFDAAAFHCYDGDPAAMSLLPAAVVTECSATTGDWRTSVGWMARELVGEALRAGSSGLLTWNLALDPQHGPKAPGGCDDCRGLVTIDTRAGTVEPTPEYAVMRHLAAAADPEAKVVATQPVDRLPVAAFVNTDGTVGIFGHNDGPDRVVVEAVVDGTTHRFDVEPWSVFSVRG